MLNDRGCRVLLVEDDATDARLIDLALTQAGLGAHVKVARSAEEAIALLETYGPSSRGFANAGPPDVIVLDMEMPGMAGEGFLEWYRPKSQASSVPVVAYSSFDDEEVSRKCFDLGVTGYMRKPEDFRKLIPAVRAALGQIEDEWERRLA